MSPSILICFALKEEAAPFQKIAADKSGIVILLTGIGSANAEKKLSKFLATNSPKLVLTCGFAGGLNQELKTGDVVFEIPQPSTFHLQLSACDAKPAKFFCADRIATTVAEKKKLRAETGADAVEMESAAIHALCRARGIPSATVRVISDAAGEDLPLDFNAIAKSDKNLDYGKLFLAVARSPGKIGALITLQKKTRLAADKLAKVLAGLIQAGQAVP